MERPFYRGLEELAAPCWRRGSPPLFGAATGSLLKSLVPLPGTPQGGELRFWVSNVHALTGFLPLPTGFPPGASGLATPAGTASRSPTLFTAPGAGACLRGCLAAKLDSRAAD